MTTIPSAHAIVNIATRVFFRNMRSHHPRLRLEAWMKHIENNYRDVMLPSATYFALGSIVRCHRTEEAILLCRSLIGKETAKSSTSVAQLVRLSRLFREPSKRRKYLRELYGMYVSSSDRLSANVLDGFMREFANSQMMHHCQLAMRALIKAGFPLTQNMGQNMLTMTYPTASADVGNAGLCAVDEQNVSVSPVHFQWLILTLAKANKYDMVEEVFERMNTMQVNYSPKHFHTDLILQCLEHKSGRSALYFVRRSLRMGVPLSFKTYESLMNSYSITGDFIGTLAVYLHCYRSHQHCSWRMCAALVSSLGRCGYLSDSLRMFQELVRNKSVSRDAWTRLLYAFANGGQTSAAIMIFEKMQSLGLKPTLNDICGC